MAKPKKKRKNPKKPAPAPAAEASAEIESEAEDSSADEVKATQESAAKSARPDDVTTERPGKNKARGRARERAPLPESIPQPPTDGSAGAGGLVFVGVIFGLLLFAVIVQLVIG